jgi:hypothetical protein
LRAGIKTCPQSGAAAEIAALLHLPQAAQSRNSKN